MVASETAENGKLDEGVVKSITGGDRIKARRMRMDFYEFEPTHQIVMQTNHKPRITGSDDGIWRRIRLVSFTRKFTGADCDPHLPDKLKAELPGILMWAWAGWRWYLTNGLRDVPEAIRAATGEYRESSDATGSFLAECCTVDRALSAKAGDLYRAYTRWCEDSGEYAKSQRVFGTALGERGFVKSRPGGIHTWMGVGICRN